ncbi:MAG: hypothetical protein D4S01_00475 [Dehalococcoidia bacterium]|nr:MAG: hypothetical protein D4S01_00475 [Dehalococcoidia bacterium]
MEAMINEMLLLISSNQTIMKYLVYDDISIDPLSRPDISDAYQYIYNGKTQEVDGARQFRLFPTPFNPNIEEEKKTYILCYINPKRTKSNNPSEKEFSLCFDILSHKELWTITGGKIRPFRICEEINNVWNKRNSVNSINKIMPMDEGYIYYNNVFVGYRLEYMGTWFNKFAEQVELENG